MNKVLQVNLDNSGGAFQLIYQAQKVLINEIEFDYYSMGCFKKDYVYQDLRKMGSNLYEANLRQNRLIGHIVLPFKFYNFLKKNKYSIVHINSDSAWKMILYALPAKILKINKIIIHSHSSEINGDHIKFKKICHYIAKKIIKYCGTDFCGCSKESIEWMYGKNFNETRIEVINNSVNSKKFKFNKQLREKIRKELKIDNSYILIGTVGNFSYQKNPEFLVELIDELNKRKINKYKLLFIGEGSEENKIKELVRKKDLDKCVVFYGKTDKVNEVLNALDIFILSSRFEGLPVSGIEAQTNGIPCIFSTAITKEVMISDYCKYIDLNDHISYWADIVINTKLENNREDAYINTINKNFDINYTATQLKKIYCSKNEEYVCNYL